MMQPILADAGIPMLFIHLPAMAIALVPVTAVEWMVARRRIPAPPGATLRGVVLANIGSTLLGFPLFWLIGVLVLTWFGRPIFEFVETLPPSGRSPAEFLAEMFWAGPDIHPVRIVVAGLAMMVPAFFVSVYSERWLLAPAWKDVEPAALRRFSWEAHLWSYPILIVTWLCFISWFRR